VRRQNHGQPRQLLKRRSLVEHRGVSSDHATGRQLTAAQTATEEGRALTLERSGLRIDATSESLKHDYRCPEQIRGSPDGRHRARGLFDPLENL